MTMFGQAWANWQFLPLLHPLLRSLKKMQAGKSLLFLVLSFTVLDQFAGHHAGDCGPP